MTSFFSLQKLRRNLFIVLGTVTMLTAGCSAEASSSLGSPRPDETQAVGRSIEMQTNGPADTVREFYSRLRQRRYREALHLTNLRPAIAGLTDTELREFAVDFEAVANLVPEAIEINGEIVTGDRATVTAKLPGEDEGPLELQEIKLRRDEDHWVILTVDEAAEAVIKREGKNYFHSLRIETHEQDARDLLERISRAQLAHALQNDGRFAEIGVLVQQGLLPAEFAATESAGYRFELFLTADRTNYYATATPAEYGKTGKLSFILEPTGSGVSKVTGRDNNGQPLKK